MSKIFFNFFRPSPQHFADKAKNMLKPTVDPELEQLLASTVKNLGKIQTESAETAFRPLAGIVQEVAKKPFPANQVVVQEVVLGQAKMLDVPSGLLPSGSPPSAYPIRESLSSGHFLKASANLLAKSLKRVFPFFPFFFYTLLTSQEKVLQNINVEITAGPKRKIYEIGFGENGEELTIAVEVQAGKPLRFLQQRSASIVSAVNPIFKSKSLFNYIPIVNQFQWRRKKIDTDCTIAILDLGNSKLREGAIATHIPLSERESFQVIHRDPSVNPTNNGPQYVYINPESSDYMHFTSASVKITEPRSRSPEHRTQIFDLPFNEGSSTKSAAYLKVTQYS